MTTVTADPSLDVRCESVPPNCAWNGSCGSVSGADAVVARALDAPASRCVGVPAVRAHPGRSGPAYANPVSATGKRTLATTPATRHERFCGHPTETRHQTASTTASTQHAVTTSIHPTFTSVPVPRLCRTAVGQLAYESQ